VVENEGIVDSTGGPGEAPSQLRLREAFRGVEAVLLRRVCGAHTGGPQGIRIRGIGATWSRRFRCPGTKSSIWIL